MTSLFFGFSPIVLFAIGIVSVCLHFVHLIFFMKKFFQRKSSYVILVDLDRTVADIDHALIKRFPEDEDKILHRKNFEFEEKDDFKFRKEMQKEGFYLNLRPIPYSQFTIRKWQNLGHRVVFVTRPQRDAPYYMNEKWMWVNKFFPGTECIIAKYKGHVNGDFLIDVIPCQEKDPNGTITPNWKQIFPLHSYNQHVKGTKFTWEQHPRPPFSS